MQPLLLLACTCGRVPSSLKSANGGACSWADAAGPYSSPPGLLGYTPGSACLQIRSQKWQDFLLAEHEADLQSKHVVEQALLHISGAVELVHGCLHWDPDQRWTAAKALQSPLFSGLPQITK